MGIQDALNAAYRQLVDPSLVRERISQTSSWESAIKELNGPFLIESTPEYELSKPRVIIVGQENNGWMDCSFDKFLSDKSIDDALAEYRSFVRTWPYKSIFFQYFADFRDRIRERKSEGHEQSVLWSNLFKLNHDGKHTLTSPHCSLIQCLQEGVFRREIEILKPDAVIFLTGPRYDDVIKTSFGEGTEISPIDGHEQRQLARVTAKGIAARMYRSYHPGFVNRNRAARKVWYDAIIQNVLAQIA